MSKLLFCVGCVFIDNINRCKVVGFENHLTYQYLSSGTNFFQSANNAIYYKKFHVEGSRFDYDVVNLILCDRESFRSVFAPIMTQLASTNNPELYQPISTLFYYQPKLRGAAGCAILSRFQCTDYVQH